MSCIDFVMIYSNNRLKTHLPVSIAQISHHNVESIQGYSVILFYFPTYGLIDIEQAPTLSSDLL